MLDKGKELDWFESRTIIVLATVALVAFVFFMIWELTEAHPIVDLRLFKGRNFTIGAATLAVAYGAFFGNVVLLPLWLQSNMGYTATDAGIVTAPVGILAIALTPIVGRLLAKRDPRLLVTFAFCIFALVCYMRSGFTPQTDMTALMIPTIIQGAAMAAFFVPLTSITLSGQPSWRIPSAAGVSNFFRLTAGAFGTSIATTLWDNRASLHHARLAEKAVPASQPYGDLMRMFDALGMSRPQALEHLNGMLNTQAFTMSALDVFYGSAIVFLLLTALVWFARPVRAKDGAASEAAAGAH